MKELMSSIPVSVEENMERIKGCSGHKFGLISPEVINSLFNGMVIRCRICNGWLSWKEIANSLDIK